MRPTSQIGEWRPGGVSNMPSIHQPDRTLQSHSPASWQHVMACVGRTGWPGDSRVQCGLGEWCSEAARPLRGPYFSPKAPALWSLPTAHRGRRLGCSGRLWFPEHLLSFVASHVAHCPQSHQHSGYDGPRFPGEQSHRRSSSGHGPTAQEGPSVFHLTFI